MKKKHFISSALCATVVSFLLFSCSSSDDVINNNNEEQNAIENLLMANSKQTVDFDINYGITNGKRITFDVYSENPQNNASARPFMSAMTDENGAYKFARIIPSGIKEVFVVSNCEGVPTLHGKISNGAVILVSGSRAGNASEFINSNYGTENYVIKDYCCAIRPLSDMIDGIENDDVLKDLVIYTISNFRIVNGDVTGVNDEVYIGSTSNIGKIIFTDFQLSLQSLLNNISVYYSESDQSRAKAKRAVHTTVKEMGIIMEESSRSGADVNSNLTPSEIIRNLIYSKKQTLMDGGYLKLKTYVEFEPVSYSEFITAIPLAPFTPFIENN